MQYDDFLKLVQSRRSIRRLKPDPIPDEYIEKMIEAARWAPSGFNSQLWEFVVVKDPKLRERIGEAVGSALKEVFKKAPLPDHHETDGNKKMKWGWQKAPVFILLFGDTRVRESSPIPPVRTDDEKWTSVFHASLACAYQHAALAAVSLGLGSQWVSSVGIPAVEAGIKEILGIPEALKIFDMLAVGYPDMNPTAKKMRPLEQIMYFDACGASDFRTDEDVRAYFGK